MWELARSYRHTLQELKQRGNELKIQMDTMPLCATRDGIVARWRLIQQEIRELRQMVGEMEDYLVARGVMEPIRKRRRRTARAAS